MPNWKVLVVENDRATAELLIKCLRSAGYETIVARNGQEGLAKAETRLPSAVIVADRLPLMDGYTICKQLRSRESTKGMLVIMLSASTDEASELVAFALGVDDFVRKPFSDKVLVERLKARLRRIKREGKHDDRSRVSKFGVAVNRVQHRVVVDGQAVPLTLTEFRILDTLIRYPGRVFSRRELIDSAMRDSAIDDRTIDVHVRGLRSKLGRKSSVIETLRGLGYRFRDQLES